jgi:hypothetical protein
MCFPVWGLIIAARKYVPHFVEKKPRYTSIQNPLDRWGTKFTPIPETETVVQYWVSPLIS